MVMGRAGALSPPLYRQSTTQITPDSSNCAPPHCARSATMFLPPVTWMSIVAID
jgi:hypothetical protein